MMDKIMNLANKNENGYVEKSHSQKITRSNEQIIIKWMISTELIISETLFFIQITFPF